MNLKIVCYEIIKAIERKCKMKKTNNEEGFCRELWKDNLSKHNSLIKKLWQNLTLKK